MDITKLICFIVLWFSSSLVQAANFNFAGALYNSPGGVLGHVYQGTKPQVENGRIRTAPNFTFGTADGKQVGFTASRLSTIATSRVGPTLVAAARLTTPIGIGVTAAALLCTETQFCEDAGNWLFGEQFDVITSSPQSCESIALNDKQRFTNAFGRTFEYTKVPHQNCGGNSAGTIFGCPDSGSGCPWGEIVTQKDLGLGVVNVPAHVPTDADWDSIANHPGLNNDSVVPDLIAAGSPVPVQDTDAMAPQNFISGTTTKTLKDGLGNITGTEVTEKTINIEDTSTTENPNQFNITETNTVTNYNTNNEITSSTTTVINNQPPAETPPTEISLDFDDMPDDQIQEIEATNSYTNVSWGSGGSCPADRSFVAMGTTFNISYEHVCNAAVTIKPMLLALAGLFSLMIVASIRT